MTASPIHSLRPALGAVWVSVVIGFSWFSASVVRPSVARKLIDAPSLSKPGRARAHFQNDTGGLTCADAATDAARRPPLVLGRTAPGWRYFLGLLSSPWSLRP